MLSLSFTINLEYYGLFFRFLLKRVLKRDIILKNSIKNIGVYVFMNYHNQTAVITGAGSGIGQALAIELANADCNLALADISAKGLEETIGRIQNDKIKITSYIADVSDKTAVAALAQKVFADYKEISLLFNVAGIAAAGSFLELKEESMEKVMQVNFFSQVYMLKQFLPHLTERKEAHIINMSSLMAIAPYANQSIYGASKAAVKNLSKVLQFELQETNANVHITTVCSGGVRTNIIKNGIPLDMPKEKIKEYVKSHGNFSTVTEGISAEKAAKIILRGVAKNKREITMGKDARWVLPLQKIFPFGYWRMIKKHIHL